MPETGGSGGVPASRDCLEAGATAGILAECRGMVARARVGGLRVPCHGRLGAAWGCRGQLAVCCWLGRALP